MKTRSEKYKYTYEQNRTKKNEKLYNDLYIEKELSNNVTLADNVSEIDIRKIKEMLNSRESYQNANKYKDFLDLKNEPEEIQDEIKEDTKKYNINELIELKRQHTNLDDDKIRKISNTQYNILNSLEIKENEDFYKQEEKLKTLIDEVRKENLTSSSFFDNLKEIPQQKRTKEDSFYSSHLGITDKDFEKDKKKGNLLTKIFIVVIVLLIITIITIFLIDFI